MTTPESFREEECSTVYWKIKNSGFYREEIESPEIIFSGKPYCIQLEPSSNNVKCTFRRSDYEKCSLPLQIAFIGSDGSAVKSYTGCSASLTKDDLFKIRRSAFLPTDTVTIRIRSPTESTRENIYIRSQIGVKHRYFLWNVKDFSNCKFNLKKSIEVSESYGDVELVLKSMGGFHTDERFYIEISREGDERCYCVLKASVLDVHGKAVNEIKGEFVFEGQDRQTGVFPAFFKKSKFLASKDLLLPNDTLSIRFDFAISLGKLEDPSDVVSFEDSSPFLKEFDDHLKEVNRSDSVPELITDLKSIFENGTFYDASLKIGSEVIRVHKNILSARSRVFRAMFSKNMEEANSNTVVIEDFDVDTVRGLLDYMYTNTKPDYEWDKMKNLYLLSDKYEVLGLKEKCSSFLKTNLSISSVSEALVVADFHRDEDLKKAAIDFISEHNSEVFASEAWKELEKSNSSLALQFMREICCNNRFGTN